jgi:hypothetical protein
MDLFDAEPLCDRPHREKVYEHLFSGYSPIVVKTNNLRSALTESVEEE